MIPARHEVEWTLKGLDDEGLKQVAMLFRRYAAVDVGVTSTVMLGAAQQVEDIRQHRTDAATLEAEALEEML